MMAEAPHAPELDDAYRALYLLPTAPRELVDGSYAALVADGLGTSVVRAAYRRIVECTAQDPYDWRPPRITSPWEIMHVRADAPSCVTAVAYMRWRGEDEAAVALVSAYEELLGPQEQPGFVSVADAMPRFSAYEELIEATADLGDPLAQPEDVRISAEHDPVPGLIAHNGTVLSITDRPVRIGAQPSCDFVLQSPARIEARVWRNKGRILLHAIGPPGIVSVNNASITWAVLSDGDTIRVGSEKFVYHGSQAT
jgi:hypothetical protein